MDTLTVEDALKELWEMFRDERDYEIRLRNWGYPYLVHVMSNAGERLSFKGDTMNDAMNLVRKWKESQQSHEPRS